LRAIARHFRTNLVGYLALLVALGGTGYAAGSKLLPPNSVGSAQVINHSLSKSDFKPGQLPRGARGATGGTGPPGPSGASGLSGTSAGGAAGGALRGSYPNPQLAYKVVAAENIRSNSITPFELARPQDWQPVTEFRNGWHNAGSAYPTAAYFVDAGSIVHLRGVIAGGTVSDAAAGTAFEVPCPLAPDDTLPHLFAVSANHAFGEVIVVADTFRDDFHFGCFGVHQTPTGWPAFVRVTRGFNFSVSLDGISWRAEFQYPRGYGPCFDPPNC
jgi:hypothetical protein